MPCFSGGLGDFATKTKTSPAGGKLPGPGDGLPTHSRGDVLCQTQLRFMLARQEDTPFISFPEFTKACSLMRLMCSSSEHESECIPPVISTGQGHKQDISGMWRKGNCYVCGACVCVCVTKNCKNLAVTLTYTFLGKLDLFVSGSFPQLPSRLKSDSQALTSLTSKQLLRCLCSNYYSLTPFPMMLFFFDCLPSWPPVSLSFFSLEVKT